VPAWRLHLNLAMLCTATEDGVIMRIACPACAAAYEVPDRLLAGPARSLRCSRCGADFPLPRSEAPEAAPPPAPPELKAEPPRVIDLGPPPGPRPEPLASRALTPIPEPPSPALARAWVASIAVVAAAVIGFLTFHAKVMEVWPASTRLFAALGLA
jgi:predicted Zn finger-like uncharacterized protein